MKFCATHSIAELEEVRTIDGRLVYAVDMSLILYGEHFDPDRKADNPMDFYGYSEVTDIEVEEAFFYDEDGNDIPSEEIDMPLLIDKLLDMKLEPNMENCL